jgi:flagellar basal-body rod modification protein FlgD
MAAAMGVFAHHTAAEQAPGSSKVSAMDTSSSGSGSSGSSSSDGATISANDFLSLLVTEMQNQDPTADTDPNEYVNQLVQVNSLEQLININQTLSTGLGTSSSTTGSDAVTKGSPAVQGTAGSGPGPAAVAEHRTAAHTVTAQRAPGNLSVPAPSAAAERVGHALDGHTRPERIAGRIPQGI